MDADFAKDVAAAIESHREPLEPPACGLILDSSVLIKAERRDRTHGRCSPPSPAPAGNIDIAVSEVTLIELATARPALTQPHEKRSGSSSSRNYYTHGTTHSSGHDNRCSSRRSDRRLEPGERRTPCARPSVDRRHGLGTRISPRSGEEFLFLTSPLIGSLTGGGNWFHSTAIPQLSKKRPCAATVENRSSHPM